MAPCVCAVQPLGGMHSCVLPARPCCGWLPLPPPLRPMWEACALVLVPCSSEASEFGLRPKNPVAYQAVVPSPSTAPLGPDLNSPSPSTVVGGMVGRGQVSCPLTCVRAHRQLTTHSNGTSSTLPLQPVSIWCPLTEAPGGQHPPHLPAPTHFPTPMHTASHTSEVPEGLCRSWSLGRPHRPCWCRAPLSTPLSPSSS